MGYHAVTAGIHLDTMYREEYTTLRYAMQSDTKSCRFVISLVLNPKSPYNTYDQHDMQLDGWLLSQPEETLALWYVEIDTDTFADSCVNEYDPHREKLAALPINLRQRYAADVSK